MTEAGFHLLRPWWLLLLPVAGLLLWGWLRGLAGETPWRVVCDPWLLPHLLVGRSPGRQRLPLVLLGIGLTVAIVALAGPGWTRVEQPAYRLSDARVIVMDLSLSMRAADYAPSRLEQARAKAVEIVQRSRGHEIGLVVFAGAAYTVAPLTYDRPTLLAFLQILDPAIMPLQGSRPDRGLEQAVELLRRAGIESGELLLICDGFRGHRVIDIAAQLREAGYRTSVLAAGSGEGVSIPLASGGVLLGMNGQPVQAVTDLAALQLVADAGGGRFVQMSSDHGDHSDLDRWLAESSRQTFSAASPALDKTRGRRRDEGPWLVLLLLPIAALAFRRGWLLSLLWLTLLLPLPSEPLYADGWDDWWWRPDQQAARALARGRPAPLLEASGDPAWRGSALYRRGDYAGAAAVFAELDNADGHYNRGNALAKAGELEAALDAYQQALARQPSHTDALYNRLLVEALLRQQQQQQQQRERQQLELDPLGDSQSQGSSAAGANRQERGQNDPGDEQQQNPLEALEQDPADSGGDEELATLGEEDGDSAERQPLEQWLKQIADDPGEILRRRFSRQHRRYRYGDTERSDAW